MDIGCSEGVLVDRSPKEQSFCDRKHLEKQPSAVHKSVLIISCAAGQTTPTPSRPAALLNNIRRLEPAGFHEGRHDGAFDQHLRQRFPTVDGDVRERLLGALRLRRSGPRARHLPDGKQHGKLCVLIYLQRGGRFI